MSRFEAAAKKAAASSGAAAPKAKAASGAASKVAAKPAAKAATPAKASGPKLLTLEDKKKYVKQHDSKVDDKAEEVRNEANKATKKTLETELKKLQSDELYKKCVEEIREAEAQAKRDAERAALTAGADKGDKVAEKAGGAKKKEAGAGSEEASEAVLKEIDDAFSGSGKDAAAAKATAVGRLEALASATPFVLPMLEKLVALFADSKLGSPAVKAAAAIVAHIHPEGHGIASTVMPVLLNGMEDKRWKVKAGCIEVLKPCLGQMASCTPGQLADCLPQIVPKLAEAALEVRAEIRTATAAVLREIGGLVASPEIKKLSNDLVTALSEPTNQKHTQGVLARMGNQTFMSLIDAASLALLMPIVVRGLKEREPMSKKWSAQIFGSTSQLVQNVELMQPYLPTVLPMLHEALTDPVAEVQREGAKVFGILEQVLPEFSQEHNQPWLFSKLRGEPGEQTGAALGLAEVLLKMDKARAAELIPEIQAGALEERWAIRRGFLELMDAMPQAMKMDFVPHIEPLFPTMLMGITADKDPNEDPGQRAALALTQRFGDLCPNLLLPSFEGAYFACLYGTTQEERQRQQLLRERVVTLLGKVADKILEHKKFGQDLLTTDDCSSKDIRERLLCLVFVMRSDTDAACKRVANGVWKNAGGAPKMQKALTPAIEKFLLVMRAGKFGYGAQKCGNEMWESMVSAGELEPSAAAESANLGETLVPAPWVFPKPMARKHGSVAAVIAAGSHPSLEGQGPAALERCISAAEEAEHSLESHPSFAPLPQCVRKHCGEVAKSVTNEGRRRKMGGRSIAHDLNEALKAALQASGNKEAISEGDLPGVCEEVVRAALGDAFDAHGNADGSDDETLLRVENLLLMYGAGHLLLKDTTLEMKRNQRYGIVGHNGAGKTTLMKEIAAHRIVGMPKDLKCVHVDDSKLGEMSKSSLSALEYCIKMGKDIGVNNAGKDTLLSVGFHEKKLNDPVAEMSTGWRMRLTLAVSMLKNADLVLLDEPTNHLDEESVAWLSTYILSIEKSSVMVISHEPKFLNKICTHVVAYVDKKLEYTEGNFDAFAMKKGLTKEQLDKMLSGNLSFDTKAADEDGEEEDGVGAAAKVAAPIAGPPKLAFPIPGTMEGVKTGSRSVLELKNVSFRYAKDKEYLISEVSGKLSLSSRVAICGRNGCGKSTLMTLLCSELSPSEGKDGATGEVWRHCNLRLAYMKQDHLKALGPFFDTSPFVYISQRFKDGFDGDLQRRLIEPEDEEEAQKRKDLAKEHGKYGNEVDELVSRSKNGNTIVYEVKWKSLDDPKQNTLVPISKLKAMGLDKVVIACDERIAAKAAGLDQRPLTRREIIKHCEAFGIDEEMCCNRQIRGFSAGQKVRLSLAAMFWTKPHLIAIDEPTNYLDVETVDALAKALTNFRGGIVMIEPKTDFVERICNEKWHLEDGTINIEKLKNGNKRQA